MRWRGHPLVMAATLFTLLPVSQLPARAQSPAGGEAASTQAGEGGTESRRGQFAGMSRVAGEVTAVSGSTLTITTEDGARAQVVTTDNTRLMKNRTSVRLADLHAGDGLMAFGNLDAKSNTLHAAVVMATDAATVKAMRENLGKTYIAGRVTAVDLDNAKMTVERTDHVAQTIGFDETTSFRRAVRGGGSASGRSSNESGSNGSGSNGPGSTGSGGNGPGGNGSGSNGSGSNGPGAGGPGMGMAGMAAGANLERAFNNGESITLADIKVGDGVAGTGTVKNGIFVPVHLVDSPPGQRRQRPAGGGPGSAGPAGASGPNDPGVPGSGPAHP